MWYNKLYIHVLLNSSKTESRTMISRMARKDGGGGRRTSIQTALFSTKLQTEDTHYLKRYARPIFKKI